MWELRVLAPTVLKNVCLTFVVVVVQPHSHVWLFATPWNTARQASLFLTISRTLPSSCPLHLWCHPAISSSDTFFSFCPQSFPASGSFPMSQLFVSDDQNTRASSSASALPVSIQSWSPLRLTALISLLSKGLLGVFSSTMVWRHQFFGVLPSLRSSSHNCMWPLGWLYRPLMAASCLCFSKVSTFAVTFLPRSNCLLISRLQSLPAVILEPKRRKSSLLPTFPLLFEIQ